MSRQAALPRSRWRQRLTRLMPWHRRLGMFACVAVFIWAGSGMLHPLMSYLNPRPATMAPPQSVIALEGLRSPADILHQADIERVSALRLMVIDGAPYYQARLPGEPDPRYWHAREGNARDMAATHARLLASHYLATDEPLQPAGRIDAFSAEYPQINRLLPAVRVDTERSGGLRVYVDLYHDRLGALVDNRKAWFSQFFLWAHSYRWLDAAGPLRPALMLFMLGATLCAVLFGLALFAARRRPKEAHRRWHGWLGLGLSLATLSFIGSGSWHLLHKQLSDPLPPDRLPSFVTGQLTGAPGPGWLLPGEELRALRLIEVEGEPVWRIDGLQYASMPSLHYVDVEGRELPDETPDRYARDLLRHYADVLGLGEPVRVSLQQRFDHEYGFVNKRLPVFKGEYADSARTSLFVDPLDGALAAWVSEADRREGWTFGYLHKWDYLNPLGNGFKNLALGVTAFAHLLLAGLGLLLMARRR